MGLFDFFKKKRDENKFNREEEKSSQDLKEELLQSQKSVKARSLIGKVTLSHLSIRGSYGLGIEGQGVYKPQVNADIYEWFGKSGNKLSLDDIRYQIEIEEKLEVFAGIPNRRPIEEDYAKIVFYNHYCFIIKRHETKVFTLVTEPFSGRFVLEDGQAIRVTLGELNKEEGSFKDRDSIVAEVNEEFGVGSSAWDEVKSERKNEYLNVMKHRLQEQTLWAETIISSMTALKNESEEVVSPKVEWTELEVKALTEVLTKLATVEENMAGKPISKEKAADIALSNIPLEIQFLGRPLPVSPELGAQSCISVVSKMPEKKKKILNQLMVNIANIDENISREEVWFMSQISPELFPMIKDLENIFPDGTFIYSIKIYDNETIETNRAIEGSLDLSALENTLLKYYQTLFDGFSGENTPAQLLERSNRMSKIKSWFQENNPSAFTILFDD